LRITVKSCKDFDSFVQNFLVLKSSLIAFSAVVEPLRSILISLAFLAQVVGDGGMGGSFKGSVTGGNVSTGLCRSKLPPLRR